MSSMKINVRPAGLDELERACHLWARKFGNVPADAREWARQARFLQFRGLSSEVVRKVLRDAKLAGDQMDSRVMDEDNQS